MSASPTLASPLSVASKQRSTSFAARFVRNRGAVAGAALLALVVLLAAGAGWLYPTDPLRIVGAPEIWPFETWRHPLGTD